MDKPNLLELAEKGIQFEHRLGKSEEALIEEAQASARWWAEKYLSGESSLLEKFASEKIAKLMDLAIAKYIKDVLS
jgi:hypothetical protein